MIVRPVLKLLGERKWDHLIISLNKHLPVTDTKEFSGKR
jgi:hypothetical protein